MLINAVGNLFFFTKDAFALLVSIGCVYWLYQRWFARKERLSLSWEGVFILILILSLMISDLLIDGALIAHLATGAANHSFCREACASDFRPQTPGSRFVLCIAYEGPPLASFKAIAAKAAATPIELHLGETGPTPHQNRIGTVFHAVVAALATIHEFLFRQAPGWSKRPVFSA